jgi:hypothetical protein
MSSPRYADRWIFKKRYGPKSTVLDRLNDRGKLRVWKKIVDAIISSGYTRGKLSIDKVATGIVLIFLPERGGRRDGIL